MNAYRVIRLLVSFLLFATLGHAELQVQIDLLDPDGAGRRAGIILIEETSYGLVFTPGVSGLSPGLHGFHVHQNPSCAPAEKNGRMVPGLAAGGHFDPGKTSRHGPPWGDGHLGDLPVLYVDESGRASTPVLAPRLKMDDLKGRSLMIHAGADNHSDQPKKLGGGGARMACGVID